MKPLPFTFVVFAMDVQFCLIKAKLTRYSVVNSCDILKNGINVTNAFLREYRAVQKTGSMEIIYTIRTNPNTRACRH